MNFLVSVGEEWHREGLEGSDTSISDAVCSAVVEVPVPVDSVCIFSLLVILVALTAPAGGSSVAAGKGLATLSSS